MSSTGPESKSRNNAGARRLSRGYLYSRPSPAAPDELSSTSTAQPSPSARSALSSACCAPRSDMAALGGSLELVPVVRAEHGFSAPRRELVNTLLSNEDKKRFAKCLVQRTVDILSGAWKIVETTRFPVASTSPGDAVASNVNPSQGPPPRPLYDGLQYPFQSTAEHMPLRKFVHEILRRSCTNFMTLQTALCYIEAIAAELPTLVKQEFTFALERTQAGYVPQPDDESAKVPAMPSPLLCPRRTFLAAILVAAKFMQDRAYSVKSWSKLTGLSAREVGYCERLLCGALDYRLWVGKGSEPSQAIDGLDMAPVIEKTVVYEPEPSRPEPQMLRKARSDVALASCATTVGTPVPRPTNQLSLPSFETLVAPIDNLALARRPPPMLEHTDLQPSCSQPQDADPKNRSSPSHSPGPSNTQPPSGQSSAAVQPHHTGERGRRPAGP